MHAISTTGKDQPTLNAEVFFCRSKAYVKQIDGETSYTAFYVENSVASEHGQSKV